MNKKFYTKQITLTYEQIDYLTSLLCQNLNLMKSIKDKKIALDNTKIMLDILNNLNNEMIKI